MECVNYQNQPCRTCGQVIEDYSTSGLCRYCWHRGRGERRTGHYCIMCGTPQSIRGKCWHCLLGDIDRLQTYRRFRSEAEHRYVWQQERGELPQGYVIHHLNGLKGDNRIENLCAMPRSEHDTKHIVTELQRRIRELEGRLDAKR